MDWLSDTRPSVGWVTPFRDPRINACSTAPRGLSQSAASFVAFSCQGIHHPPLLSLRDLYALYPLFKDRIIVYELGINVYTLVRRFGYYSNEHAACQAKGKLTQNELWISNFQLLRLPKSLL